MFIQQFKKMKPLHPLFQESLEITRKQMQHAISLTKKSHNKTSSSIAVESSLRTDSRVHLFFRHWSILSLRMVLVIRAALFTIQISTSMPPSNLLRLRL
jgi:hypothetical protein